MLKNTVLLTEQFNDGVISAKELAALKDNDLQLHKLYDWIHNGWPQQLPESQLALRPYFDSRGELTLSHGLIYWGQRALILTKAKEAMLEMLHATHQGIAAMKTLVRLLFWYPLVDSDIEQLANLCQVSVRSSSMLPAKPPVSCRNIG